MIPKITRQLITLGICMNIFSLTAQCALSVGSQAPDFALPDQADKVRTLNEFKGKYVVLYFYPKDNTPGCTKQACQLRNNFDEFKKQNIVILGINYDSPKVHKRFAQQHNLPFTLLSDSNKLVAKQYGAKSWWFLPFPSRMTFVIDPQGAICAILPKVDVNTHATKVLSLIQQNMQKHPIKNKD
jgi:peroxiredoxin Q/BCP